MKIRYYTITFLILIIFLKHDAYCDNDVPEIFVNNFYAWYITKCLETRDLPEYDCTIYKYVDKCLVKKLRINIERSNAWSDYFTSSQDYSDIWIKTFKVYDAIKINEMNFIVPVSLNINEKNAPILLVFLEKENGIFHIIKVKDIDRTFYN